MPFAIKISLGAMSAENTVPTGNPLAKTQDLLSISQVTEAPPSSTVLATAQTNPPLILGTITNSIGDLSSVIFQSPNSTPKITEMERCGWMELQGY